ncbi:DUF1906 domain-containing protein [Corynebacterium camporealensis]
MSRSFSRRGLFKAGGVAIAAGAIGAAAPQAATLGPVLGTIIDFSAGVPSAQSIKNAGHMGAIRYVSQPRPEARSWMTGKPVSLKETRANAAVGLATASIYQFGRAGTADWLKGAAGAAVHAPQAINLHKAAGGPTGRPIYIAIDDNPSRAQYTNQIRPYLRAFSRALSAAGYQTGVYGNYNTIEWAIQDGIGQFFWMHDWGSGGKIHPRTTIHQLPQSKQRKIDGVTVDINNVYARDWGQWFPGKNAAPSTPSQPSRPSQPNRPAPNNDIYGAVDQLSSQLEQNGLPQMPRVNQNGISYNGSSISNDQLRGAASLAEDVANTVRR